MNLINLNFPGGGASRFAYGEFTVETMDTYDEKKSGFKICLNIHVLVVKLHRVTLLQIIWNGWHWEVVWVWGMAPAENWPVI